MLRQRRFRAAVFGAILASALFVVATGGASATKALGMNNSQWNVYSFVGGTTVSHEHPLQNGPAAVAFEMLPLDQGFDTYAVFLLARFNGDLTGQGIAVTISIATSNYAVFVSRPDPSCTGADSAFVRFEFQTTISGALNDSNAWWSNAVAFDLNTFFGLPPITLAVSFTPDQWSNMNGESGTLHPATFAAALSDVHQVGFSFGGNGCYANGVAVNTGNAFLVFSNVVLTP